MSVIKTYNPDSFVLPPLELKSSGTVYKIRRKSDGLFSSGGAYPDWNDHGKAWPTLGRAKLAVAMLNASYMWKEGDQHYYESAEIVEFSLVEVSTVAIESDHGKAVWK